MCIYTAKSTWYGFLHQQWHSETTSEAQVLPFRKCVGNIDNTQRTPCKTPENMVQSYTVTFGRTPFQCLPESWLSSKFINIGKPPLSKPDEFAKF